MKKLKAVVVGAGWSAEGHTKAFQGNYRFWNPNAFALGGKTVLVN